MKQIVDFITYYYKSCSKVQDTAVQYFSHYYSRNQQKQYTFTLTLTLNIIKLNNFSQTFTRRDLKFQIGNVCQRHLSSNCRTGRLRHAIEVHMMNF